MGKIKGSPYDGVSLRGILVGLCCCSAIAIGEPYGVLVLHGSPLPLLWCSWYAHRLTITEQAVLDQARVITE